MGEERDPYMNVFLQECEQMALLIDTLSKDCSDLLLAFKGELTMTDTMDTLMENMFLDKVPALWAKYGWESTRGLNSWLNNLKQRLSQINLWKEDAT